MIAKMFHLGWAVVFCPRFFQDGRSKYINEITGGTKKQPSDIASLISYEYIVIHEWMHNKLFGFKFMSEFDCYKDYMLTNNTNSTSHIS